MLHVRLMGTKRAPTVPTFLNAVDMLGLGHPAVVHLISMMSIESLVKLRESKNFKRTLEAITMRSFFGGDPMTAHHKWLIAHMGIGDIAGKLGRPPKTGSSADVPRSPSPTAKEDAFDVGSIDTRGDGSENFRKAPNGGLDA